MFNSKSKKKVRHDHLTFHKDMISVKKLLGRMLYHDRVRYCGRLMLLDGTVLGEDYEFYDKFYRDWDSPRAYIPNSKTRLIMEKIIFFLEKHQVPPNFTIGKFNSRW